MLLSAYFFICVHGQEVTVENPALAADSRNPSLNRSSDSSSGSPISAQYSLVGTLIAAALAAGVGIYSAISNNRQSALNRQLQQDLTKLNTEQNERNNRFQIELKNIESKLASQKSEEEARREYEYEARKRLYQEFEPLLFLLFEYSESSLVRIYNLSLAASKGNLNANVGWLAGYGQGYYVTSTIYRLLLPMVIFKIMQQKLTLFDLDLVESYKIQYFLAKLVRIIFSEHYELANAKPQLRYKPTKYEYSENEEGAEQNRVQGVPIGIIDNMLEKFITYDNKGNLQILSYGEFEKRFFRPKVKEPFIEITHIFHNFHPRTSPVLWRILIAQVHVCRAFKKVSKMKVSSSDAINEALKIMPIQDRRKYLDWRQDGENVTEDEVFVQPFEAVEDYFSKYLSEYAEVDNI